MIAITFALPAESSDLARLVRDGKIDNREVAIFHTGVGRESAQRTIDQFLGAQTPQLLISSGFAGAVRDDLDVGDLILAENFSDRQFLSRATEILASRQPRVVKLFTSTTMVESSEQRNEIARDHGGDAVDMETEAIAQVCRRRGIPMLSLRAISDSPHQPFPAPANVLFDVGQQRTDPQKLLAHLLKHPIAIRRLLRFARQIKAVRSELTSAIVMLLRNTAL